MKILLIIPLFIISYGYGQGYNHQWLLGGSSSVLYPGGRMYIDASSSNIQIEYRKMAFLGTEGIICDKQGNFMMSSNGVWIADATNDTMLNGSGLNPGYAVNQFPDGLPTTANNVFLPYPDDSNKVALIHHTGDTLNYLYTVLNLFMSTIDLSANNGLGEVISKNTIIFSDTLNSGIGVCRHANGRDWWIIMNKDSSDIMYKLLFTPNGISVSSQSSGILPLPVGTNDQLTFARDGSKFVMTTYDDPINRNSSAVLMDFDRCTGMFSNLHVIPLTSHSYLWGLAFSPDGNLLYACSSQKIFQIDVNTYNVDTVAVYDGYISPVTPNCCPTTFWNMYLAADGKIYITTGSSTYNLHVINSPDSAGLACDVQQHSINFGTYLHLRAVPHQPNYYLGCDTTSGCPCLSATGIEDVNHHDFNIRIYPNPVIDNFLHLGYTLPQNKKGELTIVDINGKTVFQKQLPPWSNEQLITLPELNDGIYLCRVSAGSVWQGVKFLKM